MKKMIIAAFVAVTLISTAFASETNSNKNTNCCTVYSPAFTINNTNTISTVAIKENTTKTFYNNDGDLIGTTKSIAFDKLPNKAIRSISKNYPAPDYTVKACIEFTNAYGETNYYVSFDSEDTKTVVEITPYGNVSVFKRTSK